MDRPELTEIARLQLQQSVETYRVLLTLLVQICAVMVVADGTVVGFAIQQKLAGVIWVGVIFPVVMYLLVRRVLRLSLPVIATAVTIETKYHSDGVTGLTSLFVAVGISRTLLEQLRSIARLDEEPERIRVYCDLERPRFSGSGFMRWVVLGVAAAQVVAPLILHSCSGWNIFRFPK